MEALFLVSEKLMGEYEDLSRGLLMTSLTLQPLLSDKRDILLQSHAEILVHRLCRASQKSCEKLQGLSHGGKKFGAPSR